jgi:hypothetical protein
MFEFEDILPLMMVGSLSNINKTKETAEIAVRSLMQGIDTKNTVIPLRLFRIVFSELYIF